MIINKKYYKFYRTTDGYFVDAQYPSISITYELLSVGNNNEVVIVSGNILFGDTLKVEFPDENIYKLNIYFPDDSNPPNDTYDSIDIRYFPTLRKQFVELLQNKICECNTLEQEITDTFDLCSKSTSNIIAKDLYITELSANSVFAYGDLMFPSAYLRDADCCVRNFVSRFSKQFIHELSSAYDALSVSGDPEATTKTFKRFLALYYIIFFVTEIDLSNYQDSYNGVIPADDDEIEAINELFNTELIRSCFFDLELDFDTLYQTFYSCYTNNDYSTCTLTPVDTTAKLENLTLHIIHNGSSEIIAVDTFFDITERDFELNQVTWTEIGTPSNLRLTETTYLTIDNEPVSNESYIVSPAIDYPPSYSGSDVREVIWKLSANNIYPIFRTISWGFPVFYGRFDSSNPNGVPTPAEVLAGTRLVQDSYKGDTLTFPANSNTADDAWFFAVPDDNSSHYDRYSYLGTTDFVAEEMSGGEERGPSTAVVKKLTVVNVNVGTSTPILANYRIYVFKTADELFENFYLL